MHAVLFVSTRDLMPAGKWSAVVPDLLSVSSTPRRKLASGAAMTCCSQAVPVLPPAVLGMTAVHAPERTHVPVTV